MYCVLLSVSVMVVLLHEVFVCSMLPFSLYLVRVCCRLFLVILSVVLEVF